MPRVNRYFLLNYVWYSLVLLVSIFMAVVLMPRIAHADARVCQNSHCAASARVNFKIIIPPVIGLRSRVNGQAQGNNKYLTVSAGVGNVQGYSNFRKLQHTINKDRSFTLYAP